MPLWCFSTGSVTLVPRVRAGRFGRRGVWTARRRVYEAAHRESPATRCVRAAIRSRARTPKWYTGAVPLPGACTLVLNRSRTRALRCCTYAVALAHVTPGHSCRQTGHRLRQKIMADQMPMRKRSCQCACSPYGSTCKPSHLWNPGSRLRDVLTEFEAVRVAVVRHTVGRARLKECS